MNSALLARYVAAFDAYDVPALVSLLHEEAPLALLMLEIRDARITGMTSYLDGDTLFPRFGMPTRLAN